MDSGKVRVVEYMGKVVVWLLWHLFAHGQDFVLTPLGGSRATFKGRS